MLLRLLIFGFSLTLHYFKGNLTCRLKLKRIDKFSYDILETSNTFSVFFNQILLHKFEIYYIAVIIFCVAFDALLFLGTCDRELRLRQRMKELDKIVYFFGNSEMLLIFSVSRFSD